LEEEKAAAATQPVGTWATATVGMSRPAKAGNDAAMDAGAKTAKECRTDFPQQSRKAKKEVAAQAKAPKGQKAAIVVVCAC
jgi:hypothetical protein